MKARSEAPDKVRDYWRENYKSINAKQLQEEYPEHFDTDKKALATLKQLTDKGFLQSHKTSLQGKGDVRLFQPSV